MLRTFRFNLPATSKSVGELIANEVDRCASVLLQTPLTNTGVVYFGAQSREFGYLVNGAAAGLDITNLRDMFVYGTITDQLIVIIS
jgi:hypothetical protein